MIPEQSKMENLTIQQLAVYLPYDVQFEDGCTSQIFTLDVDNLSEMLNDAEHLGTISLVLHPISCLTKEITHNGETFIPIVELAKIAFPDMSTWKMVDGNCEADYETSFYYDDMTFSMYHSYDGEIISKKQYQLFQKLAEWHIDFMGLIDRGLAIDKTTVK